MCSSDLIREALRQINWTRILSIANGLDDCNDAQWRFVKGLVIELAFEKHSAPHDIEYVGSIHRDFVWRLRGAETRTLNIEFKSLVSSTLYTQRGRLRSRLSVKLTNSHGTNTKAALTAEDICDVLIILKSDGAVAVSQDTILAQQRSCGDGFMLDLRASDVIEITGCVPPTRTPLNLKAALLKTIIDAI